MSVLQVYLSWANSLLCEINGHVDNVAVVQEGKVLCEIIDILAPDAALMAKIQASGTSTQRDYIQTTLDHMKSHGVKITISAQDIIDGDIKSLLDVLWVLILNYGIHFIDQNNFQRSVGIGKKNLLEWCQGELDVAFDLKNTLNSNLCTGNWFTKLLQKFAGRHIGEGEDKVNHLKVLLQEIEDRYGVKSNILSPNDIIDGTVDEHTLMIYLSLLKRKVHSTFRSARREMFSLEGKEAAMAKIRERSRSASEEAEKRRRYSEAAVLTQFQPESMEAAPVDHYLGTGSPVKEEHHIKYQDSIESDWFSSETNSLISGRDRSPEERGNILMNEAEQVLKQTISERVKDHLPVSDRDEDKDTDASHAISERVKDHLPVSDRDEDKDTDASHGFSEKETESLSEFSSGALEESHLALKKNSSNSAPVKEKPKVKEQTSLKKLQLNEGSSSFARKSTETLETKAENSVKVNIKRPTDYYVQWEDAMDRLSHVPLAPHDFSGTSSTLQEIFHGSDDTYGSRHSQYRSVSSESKVYGVPHTPDRKKVGHFEKSGSHSPGSTYQDLQYRSRSLPLETSARSSITERRESPSPISTSNKTKIQSEKVQTKGFERHRIDSHKVGQESRYADVQIPKETTPNIEPSTAVSKDGNNFLARLEELKISGRAQRVILPDLGPDAPVLMIPGQGEEVLFLFDAMRKARLEVSLSMPKTNEARITVPSGTTGMARKSFSQTSEETEHMKANGTDDVILPKSSMQQEERGAVGYLRPSPHRHRFSKPIGGRLADLRPGKPRDPSGTQSVSHTTAPDSSRYRSVSPKEEPMSTQEADRVDNVPRFAAERIENNVKDRADVSPVIRKYSSSRDSQYSATQRNHMPSPATFRISPSSSPSAYRQAALKTSYRSPSPLQAVSPLERLERKQRTLSPLELSEDFSPPRNRAGGLGRVPRKEAWERQRQKREPRSFHTSGTDSTAQARFIEVLCKEIEELKQKIEVMEDSQAESSPERSGSRRARQTTQPGITPTSTGQNDTFYTSRSEIQETESKMLLAPRDDSPEIAVQRYHLSPRPWKASSSSLSPPRGSLLSSSNLLSSSPHREYTRSSPTPDRVRSRESPSPARSWGEDLSPIKRSDFDSSVSGQDSIERSEKFPKALWSEATDMKSSERMSPSRPGRAINLGYRSPIRSVTQEIWGKDLTSVEGLEPDRRDKYKRLISQRSLSEEEVIELKQSLASAVVENDILQAKLNNARHEIQEKLSKTNEVLDDCRRHLAKSQAENMELRTALEREKERAETNEGRAHDLQLIVQQARADNDELEEELNHCLSLLDQSRPGIDALKHENVQLQGRASVIHNENCSLKREMEDLRKSHFKAVNTIRELRTCLDEVRKERSNLQQQLSKLERLQNESKVKSIISHYSQEKGAKDEKEREYKSESSTTASERFRPAAHSHYSGTQKEELTSTPSLTKPATSKTSDVKTLPLSAGRSLNYSFEDMPPTVPSSYREIYPHRKPRYRNPTSEMYASPERPEPPLRFIDYPDLQHYPTKLDHMDPQEDFVAGYQQDKLVPYRRQISRDNSPIRKPIPYRPCVSDDKPSAYAGRPERSPERARESRVQSPQTPRGRSPVRLPRDLRESRSTSSSPMRGVSRERLSRSYDSLTFQQQKQRSASSSPTRLGRGILKNRTIFAGARDRSTSPLYKGGSHSPPTRLSPDHKLCKGACKKKLTFTRTESGQIARDLQREFDKEDNLLDELRKKHSSKSWFELQLKDPDCPTGLELAELLREENLLLSEEQRSYANELIKKYTGLKV